MVEPFSPNGSTMVAAVLWGLFCCGPAAICYMCWSLVWTAEIPDLNMTFILLSRLLGGPGFILRSFFMSLCICNFFGQYDSKFLSQCKEQSELSFDMMFLSHEENDGKSFTTK